MGLRLLLLFILVAVLVWLVRRALARPAPPSRRVTAGRMLRCAHCGLHVPADEALMDGDTPYCSDAHRQAGQRD